MDENVFFACNFHILKAIFINLTSQYSLECAELSDISHAHFRCIFGYLRNNISKTYFFELLLEIKVYWPETWNIESPDESDLKLLEWPYYSNKYGSYDLLHCYARYKHTNCYIFLSK